MNKSNGSTPPITPDATAAHEFLAELRTRISVQPLPYQDGDVTRALESLAELFGHARKAIRDNPGCATFAQETTDMLNRDLRPVTARWHPASLKGELKTLDGASAFRSDLAKVQVKLLSFANQLHQMAYGTDFKDLQTPPAISDAELDLIFADLPFGIPAGDLISGSTCSEINKDEAAEVLARRGPAKPEPTNAVGLALSGGGIRSASFCLGACQSLADHGMLGDVDFLSTVSGGGYAGAFVAREMAANAGDPTGTLKNRNGPDTDAIRALRAEVKYLAPAGLVDKWRMICSVVAGMILNWTAPAALISAFVLFLVVTERFWTQALANLQPIAMGAGVLGLVIYAALLRSNRTAAVRQFALYAALALALIALALIPQIYEWLQRLKGASDWSTSYVALTAAVAAVTPAITRITGLLGRSLVQKVVLRAALALASIAVPIIALIFGATLWSMVKAPLKSTLGPDLAQHLEAFQLTGTGLLVGLTLLLSLAAVFAINLNLNSPGRLYRNRLARSFVATKGQPETFVPLTELNTYTDGDGATISGKAPYHLINATLNLPSSSSPVLRERKGDFFVMSKHWTGAVSSKHQKTALWKTSEGDLDLATAIATSGAAVSPHMSLKSIPSVTALMSFLNVRLGLWLRKPGVPSASKRPGFITLLKEMFSWGMDENSNWLLLSDGAHVENSGIYELLRRRCKFIIACDASADKDGNFATLMTLVRHAQIDFGIQIQPDLDALRPNPETGQSAAHTLLCQIKYPGAPDGVLLILKSSITGNESELIKTYRLSNPEFPNQSTLDQSFDEAQFEAYRQLGAHVVDGLFLPSLVGANAPPATVAEWFRRLAGNLLPRQS